MGGVSSRQHKAGYPNLNGTPYVRIGSAEPVEADVPFASQVLVHRGGNTALTSLNPGKRVIDVGAIIQVMFPRR